MYTLALLNCLYTKSFQVIQGSHYKYLPLYSALCVMTVDAFCIIIAVSFVGSLAVLLHGISCLFLLPDMASGLLSSCTHDHLGQGAWEWLACSQRKMHVFVTTVCSTDSPLASVVNAPS